MRCCVRQLKLAVGVSGSDKIKASPASLLKGRVHNTKVQYSISTSPHTMTLARREESFQSDSSEHKPGTRPCLKILRPRFALEEAPTRESYMATPKPSMNKIIVYDKASFAGLSKEFTGDVPDLHELDFGNCISSLKVIGQPWVAYSASKFEGDGVAFEEGNYEEIDKNNKISSLRLVHHDLSEPLITLYEHANYEGQRKVVQEETNLAYGYFNDCVSSHVVQRGVWLLYKNPNRGGWYHVAWPGERIRDYKTELNFDESVSHLRPLQSGRPVITAKLLWDQKKVEDEKDVLIDELIGTNCTDYEQTFTANTCREYTTNVFQSFHFCNTTSLKLGFSFQVTLEGHNVFVVEKGKHESTTSSEKVEVLLPAKIPPCTQLSIQVIKKETTTTVPVELTLCQNGKEKKERAEYRCVSGRTISTRYTMTPILAAEGASKAKVIPSTEGGNCHT